MPGNGYDWKKSLKKFFTGWVYAAIPFTILYTIDFLETEDIPPEYAAIASLVVGILHLIVNAWKHWNDE